MSMSTADQLIRAIKERIITGTDKESIKKETMTAGHSEEIFEAAYMLAKKELDTQSLQDRELPSAWSLFTNGLRFARQHWKLPVLIGIPLIITAITALLMEQHATSASVTIIGSIVTVLGLLAYFVILFAALNLVGQKTEQLDYKSAFDWVKQNAWSVAIVYLFTAVVAWGGFVLFIIPGIIVSISLYFSIFALVNEGVKGERALFRSRAVVKDRWWTVFGKVVGVGFFSFLLICGFMILAGLIGSVLGLLISEEIIIETVNIIGQIVAAVVTVVTLHAGNHLFLLMREQVPATEETTGRGRYRALAAIGIVAIISFVALLVYVASNDEVLQKLSESGVTDPLRTELFAAGMTAESYAFAHDGSYEGICDVLDDLISAADEIHCNDDQEAWALSANSDDAAWCIDSSGYKKQLEIPLDDRTSCLPF